MHGQKPRHDPERAMCRSIPRLSELQPWRTAAIFTGYARPRRAARRPVPPYQQILDGLHLPEPFELTAFLARVARLRGRRIYVHPFTARHGLCGAWIRTHQADYLYHDQHTTTVHQTHILVHEIAHMLLGHEDAGPATNRAGLLTPDPGDQQITATNGRCTAYASARERDGGRARPGAVPHLVVVPDDLSIGPVLVSRLEWTRALLGQMQGALAPLSWLYGKGGAAFRIMDRVFSSLTPTTTSDSWR